MTVDLNLIAAFVGVMATILAPIIFVLKKYTGLIKKIDNTISWNKKQQQDIEEMRENNLAQNRALLAMSRSMKDRGYNHTIDEAIKTMEDVILSQQAIAKSYKEKKK